MGGTSTDLIKQRKSKQCRDRAVFFRRLATGAADPKAETGQAEIYMSQRAPDDPGTDDLEPELEQPVARRSYRASR